MKPSPPPGARPSGLHVRPPPVPASSGAKQGALAVRVTDDDASKELQSQKKYQLPALTERGKRDEAMRNSHIEQPVQKVADKEQAPAAGPLIASTSIWTEMKASVASHRDANLKFVKVAKKIKMVRMLGGDLERRNADRPTFDSLFIEDELMRCCLFASCAQSFVARLSCMCRSWPVRTGDILLKQGEPSTSFLLLLTGVVEVSVDGVCTGRLEAGQHWGEANLLGLEETGSATLEASAPGRVCEISRVDLLSILQHFPTESHVFTTIHDRNIDVRSWGTLNHKAKVFSNFSQKCMEAIDKALVRRLYCPREVLVKEGDRIEMLYLLVRGRVSVAIEDHIVQTEVREGEEIELRSLAGRAFLEDQGHIHFHQDLSSVNDEPAAFGQLALLGYQRSADVTVTCQSVCHVRVLHRQLFRSILDACGESQQAGVPFKEQIDRPSWPAKALHQLRALPLFKQLLCQKAFLDFLWQHLQDCIFFPGQSVLDTGEAGRCICFLWHGTAECLDEVASSSSGSAAGSLEEDMLCDLQEEGDSDSEATTRHGASLAHRASAPDMQAARLARHVSVPDMKERKSCDKRKHLLAHSSSLASISKFPLDEVAENSGSVLKAGDVFGDIAFGEISSAYCFEVRARETCLVKVLHTGIVLRGLELHPSERACLIATNVNRRQTSDLTKKLPQSKYIFNDPRRATCPALVEAGVPELEELQDSSDVFLTALKGSGIFMNTSADFIKAMAEISKTRMYMPGDIIVEEGKLGSSMFVLLVGTAEAWAREGVAREAEGKDIAGRKAAAEMALGVKDLGRKVANFGTGSIFGEMAMLGIAAIRMASIQATSLCTTWEICQAEALPLLEHFPQIKGHMRAIMVKHLERTVVPRIISVPLFTDFDRKFKIFIGIGCDRHAFLPEQIICRENQAGTHAHVINIGLCQLERFDVIVKSYTPGTCFGAACLVGADRTYPGSLRAVQTCHIMSISRLAYLEALQVYPSPAASKALLKSETSSIKELRANIDRAAIKRLIYRRYQEQLIRTPWGPAQTDDSAEGNSAKLELFFKEWRRRVRAHIDHKGRQRREREHVERMQEKWVDLQQKGRERERLRRQENGIMPLRGEEKPVDGGPLAENKPMSDAERSESQMEALQEEWPAPKPSQHYSLKMWTVLEEICKDPRTAGPLLALLPRIGRDGQDGVEVECECTEWSLGPALSCPTGSQSPGAAKGRSASQDVEGVLS
mmetsp:Transcript_65632/g.140304  ORF Transcript_65632/g.140304 Transcript_65632/m.140304 type:complete len:1222 (-) Transcript_65632:72-3737(-)